MTRQVQPEIDRWLKPRRAEAPELLVCLFICGRDDARKVSGADSPLCSSTRDPIKHHLFSLLLVPNPTASLSHPPVSQTSGADEVTEMLMHVYYAMLVGQGMRGIDSIQSMFGLLVLQYG